MNGPEANQELHLTQFQANGHIMSTDCWCEPSLIRREQLPNYPGQTLIVQHRDETPMHHIVVLATRERDPDWVTQLLSEVSIRKD